ncbi:MAG: GNAT family N-acetyltransferase [Thermomicrobiales bacterium]
MPERDEAISIEDLRADDEAAIDQIAALLLEAFPGWQSGLEEAREEVRESFGEDHLSLVARDGAQVLGWIGAIHEYDYAWELHPLAVIAEARGRGVGTALVGALEARLRALGALTVYLGSDDDGDTPGTSLWGADLYPDPLAHAAAIEVIDHPVSFYRRHGYTVIGVIPDANGPGKPDILMGKRLAP